MHQPIAICVSRLFCRTAKEIESEGSKVVLKAYHMIFPSYNKYKRNLKGVGLQFTVPT